MLVGAVVVYTRYPVIINILLSVLNSLVMFLWRLSLAIITRYSSRRERVGRSWKSVCLRYVRVLRPARRVIHLGDHLFRYAYIPSHLMIKPRVTVCEHIWLQVLK